MSEQEKPRPARWFRATSASSLGIEIALAICLGFFAGVWLENNVTHVRPWTMLAGLAIGIAAAGKAIQRTIRQYHRDLQHGDGEASRAEGEEEVLRSDTSPAG